MIRRLIILLLIVGCDNSTEPEPEDCAGVEGGTAVEDDCGTCDDNSTNDCQFYDFFIPSDKAIHSMGFEITGVTVLGIEPVSGFDIEYKVFENYCGFLMFSMQGQALPAHLTFTFSGSIENLCFNDMILADNQGNSIEIIYNNCD